MSLSVATATAGNAAIIANRNIVIASGETKKEKKKRKELEKEKNSANTIYL